MAVSGAKVYWLPGRTTQYIIWKACQRLGVRPPGVKESWDECGLEAQALMIAFEQISSYDELEQEAALAGAKIERNL